MTAARLGSVVTFARNTIEPDQIPSGTKYVGLEDISGDGEIKTVREVSNGELASTKFAFDPAHVLYGKLRPYLRKVALPNFCGVCSTDIIPLLPSRALDRCYLFHYLRLPRTAELATARSTGANLPRISPSILGTFEIPLPPLSEQRRIAAILDKAHAICRKRRDILRHENDLVTSLFFEHFGDSVRNTSNWKVIRLADACTKITDGEHARPTYTEQGVPFISVKDITTGRLELGDCKYISAEDHKRFVRRCRPEGMDILYTKVGATYGRAALVDTDREFSLYVSVALLKPKRDLVNPYFLKELLGTPLVKRQADRCVKGAGVPDLHLVEIKNFSIPLPPMPVQERFVSILKRIHRGFDTCRKSTKEAQVLFNSIVDRAFAGEI